MAKKAASKKPTKKSSASKAVKKTKASKTASAQKKTPKKTTAAKPTKKKSSASIKSPVKKATTKKTSATVIVANIDVGFGNHLYIRGEGPGLSWSKGAQMSCSNGNEWTWKTTKATSPIECKFLINDSNWSAGENIVVKAKVKSAVKPRF